MQSEIKNDFAMTIFRFYTASLLSIKIVFM